jgi:hypothetical protein
MKKEFLSLIERAAQLFPMPEGELARLQRRKWILANIPKSTVGAEIGVFRGHFTEIICEVVSPSVLYLIDPWTKLGKHFGWGAKYTCFNTLTTEAAKQEAVARSRSFPDTNVIIVEDTFPECAEALHHKLDFVYLDASHKYGATIRELEALESHMADGGIILGDDWYPDESSIHHGVFLAVQRFTRTHNWELFAAGPGAQWGLRRRHATTVTRQDSDGSLNK